MVVVGAWGIFSHIFQAQQQRQQQQKFKTEIQRFERTEQKIECEKRVFVVVVVVVVVERRVINII